MSLLGAGLLSAGLLLLLLLGGLALVLWRRLAAQQSAYARAEDDRQHRLRDELRSLASGLLDGRLPLIEGAIRLKVVLDNYSIALSNHPRCRVFHRLFDATSGIPSHNGWKVLSDAERRAYERHFAELELQHQAEARQGARWLLDEGLAGH